MPKDVCLPSVKLSKTTELINNGQREMMFEHEKISGLQKMRMFTLLISRMNGANGIIKVDIDRTCD